MSVYQYTYLSKQSVSVFPCFGRRGVVLDAPGDDSDLPFIFPCLDVLAVLPLLPDADTAAPFFFFSRGRNPKLISSIGSNVVVTLLHFRHVTLDWSTPANVLWTMHEQFDMVWPSWEKVVSHHNWNDLVSQLLPSHPLWILFNAPIKNSWASCWA